MECRVEGSRRAGGSAAAHNAQLACPQLPVHDAARVQELEASGHIRQDAVQRLLQRVGGWAAAEEEKGWVWKLWFSNCRPAAALQGGLTGAPILSMTPRH